MANKFKSVSHNILNDFEHEHHPSLGLVVVFNLINKIVCIQISCAQDDVTEYSLA